MKIKSISVILLVLIQICVQANMNIPASAILNIDGTFILHSGIKGELDFTGYEVSMDNEYGPMLLNTDPEWNTLGPGLNDLVHDIIIDGNDIYVGGQFINAGGIEDADYIARWDGCEWHAVGAGLNLPDYQGVWDIAKDGAGGLYVGGYLSPDENPFISFIYHWDGLEWNEFGPALNSTVVTIAVDSNDIYVGGIFTGGIAKWNGIAWEILGLGLTHQYIGDISVESVNDIELLGPDLYVGGRFNDIGGNSDADKIARWDGTSWQSLGAGWIEGDGYVNDVLLHGNDVYVCGILWTNPETIPDHYHVARWDGNVWHDLDHKPAFWCYSMAILDNYLYASSSYYYDTISISRFDMASETWELFALVSDLENRGIGTWVLTSDEENLYAGGYFDAIDDQCLNRIARWGEPDILLHFQGVPDTICDTDPPILLPIEQDGYTGTWSGQGVVNNVFDPDGLSGIICLTFITDKTKSDQCNWYITKNITIGCNTTSTHHYINDIPQSIRIFPNPCSDIVHIDLKYDNSFSNVITIRDLTGRTILSQETNANELDISALPSGLYFLNIRRDEINYTARICKY